MIMIGSTRKNPKPTNMGSPKWVERTDQKREPKK